MLVLCCSSVLWSCGDPVGGSGTSEVFITVQGVTPWGIPVDVYNPAISGNVELDVTNVKFNSRYRDPSGSTITDLADVLIQEQRVTYFRYDGNPNVPEPFLYPVPNMLVPAGGTLDLEIPIVLAKAKLESPLKELAFGGGEGEIQLQAKVDFYGKDVSGNSVHCYVTLSMIAKDY